MLTDCVLPRAGGLDIRLAVRLLTPASLERPGFQAILRQTYHMVEKTCLGRAESFILATRIFDSLFLHRN